MKKFWVVLILLAAAGGLVFFIIKNKPGSTKGEKRAEAPIPVELGRAKTENVDVWLTGIGTVQASQTVTVRPRVGGVLLSVDFEEGAQVKAGDVLARIDPRPYEAALAQAEAKKAQDETQLATAQVDAKRLTGLLRENAVARQQVEQADALAAQLAALIKADDALIRAAKLDLDFTTVRSPISGVTGIRRVDAGNIVTASQAEGIVTVAQMSPAAVVFSLPQRELPELMKATKNSRRPKVEALDERGQVIGSGELELLDNEIDQATGTIRLKAIFPNKDAALWPGRFVTARVLVDTFENALIVPRIAVQPGMNGDFVYVLQSQGTVEARNVTTGRAANDHIVIQNGLKDGEQIVLSGQIKLRPGSKVTERRTQP